MLCEEQRTEEGIYAPYVSLCGSIFCGDSSFAYKDFYKYSVKSMDEEDGLQYTKFSA